MWSPGTDRPPRRPDLHLGRRAVDGADGGRGRRRRARPPAAQHELHRGAAAAGHRRRRRGRAGATRRPSPSPSPSSRSSATATRNGHRGGRWPARRSPSTVRPATTPSSSTCSGSRARRRGSTSGSRPATSAGMAELITDEMLAEFAVEATLGRARRSPRRPLRRRGVAADPVLRRRHAAARPGGVRPPRRGGTRRRPTHAVERAARVRSWSTVLGRTVELDPKGTRDVRAHVWPGRRLGDRLRPVRPGLPDRSGADLARPARALPGRPDRAPRHDVAAGRLRRRAGAGPGHRPLLVARRRRRDGPATPTASGRRC